MNFLQIAQDICDELDINPPFSTIYATDLLTLSSTQRRVRSHINLAYNVIKLALGLKSESHETSTTLSTVADQENYSFPTGILTIEQLKVSTDPPIRILPWTEYERHKSDNLLITIVGYPDIASIYGRQIYFFPTPDAAYTVNVRGIASLTELNLDADTPTLPNEFHRAIRELALYYGMAYEGNPQAGSLNIGARGELIAQGGQAARAVNLFNLIKGTFKNHFTEPPRIIGPQEMRHFSYLRRIVRS